MASVYIAPASDIPEGSAKTVTVQGKTIAIFHVGNRLYALDDRCSHAEASLGEGEIDADEVRVACPRHGALFDLHTGRALSLPAHKPVASYPVWVDDERIYIDIDVDGK